MVTSRKSNQRTLSAASGEGLAELAKNTVTGDKKLPQVIEALKEDGFKMWTDFVSPNSTGANKEISTVSPDEWALLLKKAKAGLDLPGQQMLEVKADAVDKDGLPRFKQVEAAVSPFDKWTSQNRKYWARQPNAVLGRIAAYLKRRQVPKPERTSRTVVELAFSEASSALNRIVNANEKTQETFKFDIDDVTTGLKAALTALDKGAFDKMVATQMETKKKSD